MIPYYESDLIFGGYAKRRWIYRESFEYGCSKLMYRIVKQCQKPDLP